jgi:hypothetical protein
MLDCENSKEFDLTAKRCICPASRPLKEMPLVWHAINPNTSTTRTRNASLARKKSYIIHLSKLASVAPPINPSSLMIAVSLVP